MINSKTGEPPVSMAEAERRVLEKMSTSGYSSASTIAWMVWPKHRMKAQGAAMAVGVLIRKLCAEKKITFVSGRFRRGYRKL